MRLSVSGFAYFRTEQQHGVRNRSVSDAEMAQRRHLGSLLTVDG